VETQESSEREQFASEVKSEEPSVQFDAKNILASWSEVFTEGHTRHTVVQENVAPSGESVITTIDWDDDTY